MVHPPEQRFEAAAQGHEPHQRGTEEVSPPLVPCKRLLEHGTHLLFIVLPGVRGWRVGREELIDETFLRLIHGVTSPRRALYGAPGWRIKAGTLRCPTRLPRRSQPP